jgi:hypothetical protein
VVESPDVALHAGALSCDGRAWLITGPREAGKSTLLHAAHRERLPVICDDTSVVSGGFVLSGPRCLDLRAPVPGSEPVRDGMRHRVTLEPVPWRVPLAGFVHLAWDEDALTPRLAALDPAERLAALADAPRNDAVPSQAVGLLDLVAWPAYSLRRRRDADAEGVLATLRSRLA